MLKKWLEQGSNTIPEKVKGSQKFLYLQVYYSLLLNRQNNIIFFAFREILLKNKSKNVKDTFKKKSFLD